MPALFRKTGAVTCFYCQEMISPPPSNPRSFKCGRCSCWNKYDARGQITSDEPAMHEESLNATSFARRASPTKDRLPPTYSRGPFCHTCQTNQTLVINLLANYLPSQTHPEYASRVSSLPAYRASLETRYPQVCAQCMPDVEEEIRRKDHMARTSAFGGWLKESKGRREAKSKAPEEWKREKLSLVGWRIRGVFWALELLCVLGGYATGALGYPYPAPLRHVSPFLPSIFFASLTWMYWDPTYSSVRYQRLQGRDVRVIGRSHYIRLQSLAWGMRMLMSCMLALAWAHPDLDVLQWHYDSSPPVRTRALFAVMFMAEIVLLIRTSFVLQIHRPPTIRLIDTSTHLREATPSTVSLPASDADPSLLSTLSLSAGPVITTSSSTSVRTVNPIFGLPSLHARPVPAPTIAPDAEPDPDAMDWSPTETSISAPRRSSRKTDDDDTSWLLRPQRFFAPEQPTGLETLLARTGLSDENSASQPSSQDPRQRPLDWKWYVMFAVSVTPFAAGVLGTSLLFFAGRKRNVDMYQLEY